ncbi:MAG: hypothetical protein IJ002_07810 [Clostridia bacterium]|nr:hypothetical protein [Clostridia bacterium]
MTDITIKAMKLMEMLPEEEKAIAYEFIKNLVLKWDPDFTKVTPDEAKSIDEAKNSGFIDKADIDWDNLH